MLLKIRIGKELKNCLFAWFVYFEASARTFSAGKNCFVEVVVRLYCVPAVRASNRGR